MWSRAVAALRAAAVASVRRHASTSASPKLWLTRRRVALLPLIAAGGACGVSVWQHRAAAAPQNEEDEEDEDVTELCNWSGTHHARTSRFFQPETLEELQTLLEAAHAAGQRLRAVGSALSPNAIGLSDDGMVSLASCNRVLAIDTELQQVTVEAGARVDDVVEALRPHGMTLLNYASVREQQIGGFTQVGAHGTGVSLSPVDEHVVSLTLHTPAKGVLTLSPEHNSELFYMARIGLGSLGVVGKVTLQCCKLHYLKEETQVMTRKEVVRGHLERLHAYKHIRYMWLPYEDAVVVVKSNECDPNNLPTPDVIDPQYALQPLRDLLCELTPISAQTLARMSFADLRDAILAASPLSVEHVKRCNRAEAEFWRRSQGVSAVGTSDQVLGFECGGQQWVREVVLPVGTRCSYNGNDLNFMSDLLEMIERGDKVPAPCPIEQRWSSGSQSSMSQVHREEEDPAAAIYSWVGIIMYLCSTDEEERNSITAAFKEYCHLVSDTLEDKYDAYVHWAKLERLPHQTTTGLKQRLATRFPVRKFNAWRRELDPRGVLSNDMINCFFGTLQPAEANKDM